MSDSFVALPDPLITASPNRLGGMPVFAGTRVPIKSLFDYLEGGETIDEFFADFPNVSREHAVAVLELALRTTTAELTQVAAE